jgi:death-on-curing protein
VTSSFYWLSVQEVIALHDEVIEDFGGSLGILNEGALDSTLNRPKQLAYYEPESGIFDFAAAYGHGLVKNHCFLDGNKRTALAVMAVFLLRNRYELTASELETVDVMVNLAKGHLSQAELAVWLSRNTTLVG